MIAIRIKQTKEFMSRLLTGEDFDFFLLEKLSITTFNTFTIDGHLQRDFYTSEEWAGVSSGRSLQSTARLDKVSSGRGPQSSGSETDYASGHTLLSAWSDVKPIAYTIIKGKKAPVSFRIVLRLKQELMHSLIRRADEELRLPEGLSFALIITYSEGGVTLTTGTSSTEFFLDKTVDKIWDHELARFLDKLSISFELA